jgi:hypothetical protein
MEDMSTAADGAVRQGKKVRECLGRDDKWKVTAPHTHFPATPVPQPRTHTLPPHGTPSTPQSKMVRLHPLACSSARAASL